MGIYDKMIDKKKKIDSRRANYKNWARNEEGTYGIVGEDGEVITFRRIKQLFRSSVAADNMKIELQRERFWEKLRVEKLK